MKLGVQMFVTPYTIGPVEIGRAVEGAGFESIWLPHHTLLSAASAPALVPPAGMYSAQLADPFVALAFIAAATKTLRLGTAVCVLPERHPFVLAKQVSTLDRFSDGRLTLGFGMGYMDEELALLGVDPKRRWTYSQESIAFMKGLWRDGRSSIDGEVMKFPMMVLDMPPVQRPHPPILIGAKPTPLAIRRMAAWADGWLPGPSYRPEQIRAVRAELNAECERIGRDPAEIQITALSLSFDAAMRDAYEEAGADRLIFALYNHAGEPLEREQWMPALMKSMSSPPPRPDETLRALDHARRQAGL